MSVAHLPGCDLRHTQRQRCSTWAAPAQPGSETDEPRPEPKNRAPTPSAGRLALGAVLGCSAFITVPLFLGAALLVSVIAADRLDWIDVGTPNYIREAKPSSTKLVIRKASCGATGEFCDVMFFYGTDTPYDEILAHYREAMARRSFPEFQRDAGWSAQRETVFQDPHDANKCFSLVPFDDSFDLTLDLMLRTDAEALRADLSRYAHPYVGIYTNICHG
jgi:hypothetical protein